MKRLRDYLKDKPHVAITVPAVLCFVTFVTNFIAALKDGVIDENELHQLLSVADGFGTVACFLAMSIVRNKNK